MTVWVLTSEQIQHNSNAKELETVFKNKPTPEKLEEYFTESGGGSELFSDSTDAAEFLIEIVENGYSWGWDGCYWYELREFELR